MQFTASFIEANIGKITANAVFADPETNPDAPAVLMFSRAVEFEGAAYYFEINDQSNSSYGGLKSVRVTRNSLEAEVEPELVEKFGDDAFAKVQIQFEVDDNTYQSVLRALRKIFEDEDGLLVVESA